MKVEIEGISEAIQSIEAVPNKIMRKGVSGGLRSLGKEGVKDLKAAVPVVSGGTRRSIGSRVLKKRGDELAALKIGETRNRAGKRRTEAGDHVLRWLETGVKKHVLMAWDANNKRLTTAAVRRMNRSGAARGRALLHPGFGGRYLLRQLIASHGKKYAERFAEGMRAAIDKAGAA